MVTHLLKMSLGTLPLTLAFCVTLTNLGINLGGEAILRVGNLGVLPSSRAKVETQFTPNSTVGGDGDAAPAPFSLIPYTTHVQCSVKFQNRTFMVRIMARHIRMLLC